MRFLCLLPVLALCACQSKPVTEMSYSELRAYAADLNKRCYEQGVKTKAELQMCVRQEAISDEANRRNAIETRRRIGRSLANMGAAMEASRPVTTNCSRTTWGSVSCTTW